MISNSTTTALLSHHHYQYPIDSVVEPTAINELSAEPYDSAGAALFIIVVLLWYSLSNICFVRLQIRARSETLEDCARRRAKLFIQTLRDQTQTKEILEELVDKQKRAKLWNIYLGKTDNNKEKLKRDEVLRIKNIEKQLAVLNRSRMIMNDSLTSLIVKQYPLRRTISDSRSTFISHLPKTENQSHLHRRSSLNEQTIERLKSTASQNQAPEQIPWHVRKVLIRRHFRRGPCRTSFKQSQPTNKPMVEPHPETTDDEQCHLLQTCPDTNDSSRQRAIINNERLNPYITYFHLPISEQSKPSISDQPLVAIHSDHHIVQINDNETRY